MKQVLTFLVLVTALALSAQAKAQQQRLCSSRTDMVSHLQTKYGEQPTAIGVTSSGNVLEIASNADGSFSVFVTTPDMESCLVAAGNGWHVLSNDEKAKLKKLNDPES